MLSEGELVYLLDEKGKRHFLRLERGMLKIVGLGVVDSSKILGSDEGVRINFAGNEFVVLRPGTVELMDSLERGAQVIMPKDAATICLKLDLKDGDVVLEAGVGSGSLTTALLSRVSRSGRVLSIELREDFGSKARRNMERSPFRDLWTLIMGDVTKADIPVQLDAAVLDMPNPWDALPNLMRRLRPGGRLCAYVPNNNQVEDIVRRMDKVGFVEIEVLENIQRNIEVHDGGVRPSFEMLGHTGYLVFGRMTASGQVKG